MYSKPLCFGLNRIKDRALESNKWSSVQLVRNIHWVYVSKAQISLTTLSSDFIHFPLRLRRQTSHTYIKVFELLCQIRKAARFAIPNCNCLL